MNKAMDKFEVNNASKIVYIICLGMISAIGTSNLQRIDYIHQRMKLKSAVLTRAIKMFENLLRGSSGLSCRLLRKNRGGEFMNGKMAKAFQLLNIQRLDEEKITVEDRKGNGVRSRYHHCNS
ncbi:MAG: hypothetical protein MZV64_15215 [Ignavibacteriales bacterium]|nr:hypothetical protein [Ignavibacteriales bacterium]